jgi:hypothetical protein
VVIAKAVRLKQSQEHTVIAKEERLKQSHDKKQIATAFIKSLAMTKQLNYNPERRRRKKNGRQRRISKSRASFKKVL